MPNSMPTTTNTRRRKHWGWGCEDGQPSRADLEAAAPGIRERLGFGGDDGRGAGAARGDRAAASRASSRPPRWPRSSAPTATTASRTRSARPTATSCAASAAGSTTRPTSSPARATRPRSRRVLEWCAEAGRGGDPVRRRDERRGRRRAADRRTPTPAPSRSTSARSTACSRSTRPRARRGSRPARSARRSRTSCAPHGLTLRHFPQSFEFSTPRRLDRDPGRRPLRDALHAHRRPRRVGARDHARRASGRAAACPAPAPGRAPTGC